MKNQKLFRRDFISYFVLFCIVILGFTIAYQVLSFEPGDSLFKPLGIRLTTVTMTLTLIGALSELYGRRKRGL
ncbi:MAG: hypothetical protein AAGC88_12215 [Bacteroidota bacterium]